MTSMRKLIHSRWLDLPNALPLKQRKPTSSRSHRNSWKGGIKCSQMTLNGTFQTSTMEHGGQWPRSGLAKTLQSVESFSTQMKSSLARSVCATHCMVRMAQVHVERWYIVIYCCELWSIVVHYDKLQWWQFQQQTWRRGGETRKVDGSWLLSCQSSARRSFLPTWRSTTAGWRCSFGINASP